MSRRFCEDVHLTGIEVDTENMTRFRGEIPAAQRLRCMHPKCVREDSHAHIKTSLAQKSIKQRHAYVKVRMGHLRDGTGRVTVRDYGFGTTQGMITYTM